MPWSVVAASDSICYEQRQVMRKSSMLESDARAMLDTGNRITQMGPRESRNVPSVFEQGGRWSHLKGKAMQETEGK